jgi:antitoxin ParD1/3/4
MQRVERLSITLPTEMTQSIRAAVEQGGYASNSEVVREAMRMWQEQEHRRTERYKAIREKIVEADADPRSSLSDNDVGQHFEARLKRSLTVRGEHD